MSLAGPITKAYPGTGQKLNLLYGVGTLVKYCALDRIRTCDLKLRKLTLYPTELREQILVRGPAESRRFCRDPDLSDKRRDYRDKKITSI